MLVQSLLIASVAALAAGQSTQTCSGQVILDACKGTIQAQVNACGYTDYSCLCTAYTNMVGCYASAGCPNDVTIGTPLQLKQLNCNNASVYGATSSTRSLASATASAVSATTTSSAASATSGSSSGSASASSARASATSSSNDAQNVKNAGGLLAIVAAGIVAML